MKKSAIALKCLAVAAATLSLPLTGHCFYNASSGKWLSRDPIGEIGGSDLSGIASNDLINRFDPIGLCTACKCVKVSVTTTRTLEMISVNDFKNIGLRVPYHFEIEGDKNYCKCGYSDRGKVN